MQISTNIHFLFLLYRFSLTVLLYAVCGVSSEYAHFISILPQPYATYTPTFFSSSHNFHSEIKCLITFLTSHSLNARSKDERDVRAIYIDAFSAPTTAPLSSSNIIVILIYKRNLYERTAPHDVLLNTR